MAPRDARPAYIESFNVRFRDECLNDHWLLVRARLVLQQHELIEPVRRGSRLQLLAGVPGLSDDLRRR